MQTYLGIELGSTRIKAAAIDEHFQPVSAGDRDLITSALLFDGGHSIVIPPFPLAPWPPMCYYKWVDYGLG